MMEVERLAIGGVLLLRPRVFTDDRGHFLETFNERVFQASTGLHDVRFLQDNESLSHCGVLRGLHYQMDPHAQGKLVRVLAGSVLDVVVDLRPGSPTRGRHITVPLDAERPELLWVPPGMAHGFVALADATRFAYKCTDYYHQPSERTIRWDDPELGIDWGINAPFVSAKDQAGARWRDALAEIA
jgi:dTDP-4-dehydrorhamnose 3,5-epimerase